jgi:hypothetical protein
MGILGKPLLIHYHIYKNAGSSVEKNLLDSFGEKWVLYDGSPDAFRLSSDDIAAFAAANPAVCAISSHKARPFRVPMTFFPILFLRHPIDRARSAYYFAKRDPAQLDHPLARDTSFQGYVNWWLDRPNSAIRNYQVIHLSQASLRVTDISEAAAQVEDLREVCTLLSSLRFFGLVRRFHESSRGFEVCYRRVFPELKMNWVRENRSTEEGLSEADALQAARDELGEAAYARLVEANRLDLALYETAIGLFDRNLARLSAQRLRRAGHAFVDLCRGAKGGRRPLRWRWAAQ